MKFKFFLPLIIFFGACNTTIVHTEEPIANDSISIDTVAKVGIAYIYDITSIPQITLEITTAEWNKLLGYYDQNPNNEEYIKSNFSFF